MKPLSPAGALFCALFNAETRAYPSYEGRRLEPGEIASGIRKELAKITTAEVVDPGFSSLLAKARESLAEAKSQTEYQDQKIARLLTIVSFVTAAAGTIFSKVVDSYPIDRRRSAGRPCPPTTPGATATHRTTSGTGCRSRVRTRCRWA